MITVRINNQTYEFKSKQQINEFLDDPNNKMQVLNELIVHGILGLPVDLDQEYLIYWLYQKQQNLDEKQLKEIIDQLPLLEEEDTQKTSYNTFCVYCNSFFRNVKELQNHLLEKHRREIEKQFNEIAKGKSIANALRWTLYDKYLYVNYPELRKECIICGKLIKPTDFTSRYFCSNECIKKGFQLWEKIVEVLHQKQFQEPDYCPYCQKEINNVISHLRFSQDCKKKLEEEFDEIAKQYGTVSNLNLRDKMAHLISYKQTGSPILCKNCGKVIVSSKNPYCSAKCKKEAKERYQEDLINWYKTGVLRKYIKLLSKQSSKYRCPVCGKTFKTTQQLRAHLKKSTNCAADILGKIDDLEREGHKLMPSTQSKPWDIVTMAMAIDDLRICPKCGCIIHPRAKQCSNCKTVVGKGKFVE